ncbi:MAG TPA: tetratricopeptide repeat protein [Pedobacter sp.]|uniref:tetratricopeptide repeat protein n=1 Tax=Pedobacter sp. TaxID=1411316 RepID=UPI002C6B0D10|nr:tetratricopeptide repeat protein [Pedobacter sp.]HMI03637.1 tetratricopeptide repeat protein [Pedobacter sp.]
MKRILFLFIIFLSVETSRAQDSLKFDKGKLLEYYQAQQYAEASAYLKGIYRENTENKKELSELGYAFLLAGKLPEAEKTYLKLYAKDSASIPVLYSLADINIRRGNNSQARKYYLRALQADSTSYITYKQLSKLSKADLDINRIEYLRKANDLNPEDAEVAFDLAELYFKMNFMDRAAAVIAPALKADSANLQLLKMRMPINTAESKYKESIETGQKLLSYGDSSTFVLNNLGKAYYLTLDYKNALKYFLLIKENMIDKEALYFNIARSYRGVRDYNNAVVYLQKAVQEGVSPLVASYYGLLGDSFEKLSKNEDANKAYKKGLDFENDGSLLYNIALVYETKLNDKKNAISYYEQYLKTIDKGKQPKLVKFINTKIEDLKR